MDCYKHAVSFWRYGIAKRLRNRQSNNVCIPASAAVRWSLICRHSQNQIGETYFIPLNSVFLSSSCRLIEINYLLLIELVPLHQKYQSRNPQATLPYALPPSVMRLYNDALNSSSTAVSTGMEIEPIDDNLVAIWLLSSNKHSLKDYRCPIIANPKTVWGPRTSNNTLYSLEFINDFNL